jgi:CRP-like cAMP-binding protein
VPLLAHLSEESIGRLADALQHVHVAAGETVVAEGDESSGRCFIVEQGALRVESSSSSSSGAAALGSYVLGVGDCFGGEALRPDEVAGRQPASVVAVEDARLLVMDRATALRLVFAGDWEGEGSGGEAPAAAAGVEEEEEEEEEEELQGR